MIGLIGLAASTANFNPENVPVERSVVTAAEYRVPPGDSVRASTWDEISSKPSQPIPVRVACIVMLEFGVPGACIPASRLPAGTTVNWAAVRDAYERAPDSREAQDELIRTAEKRLSVSRLKPANGWAVRIFEEVISPADARPTFEPGEAFTLRDVIMTKPLDGKLVKALYPVAPLRNGAAARVSLTCKIEQDFRLLCRDPGVVKIGPPSEAGNAQFAEAFRLATYQLASTISLQPKSYSGQDVVGRNLTIAINWLLP